MTRDEYIKRRDAALVWVNDAALEALLEHTKTGADLKDLLTDELYEKHRQKAKAALDELFLEVVGDKNPNENMTVHKLGGVIVDPHANKSVAYGPTSDVQPSLYVLGENSVKDKVRKIVLGD